TCQPDRLVEAGCRSTSLERAGCKVPALPRRCALSHAQIRTNDDSTPCGPLGRAQRRSGMAARLQSGLFPDSTLFAAFKKLHWVSRHDGRYGVLVDKLGMPIPSQQHAKIVEPGHHPLQLHAIDEKNSEGDFC